MASKCPNCGLTQMPRPTCKSCGGALHSKVPRPTAAQASAEQPISPSPPRTGPIYMRMEKSERKRGVLLSTILIILALDGFSGFVYYLLVVTGHQESVLPIPFWANHLFLGSSFLDLLLIIAIWMWKKWAVFAEGLLLVVGFIIGINFFEIPIYALMMTPILFGVLLLALKPKWMFLE